MNKNAGNEYQFYLQQQMQLQQEEDAYIAEAERRAEENVSKQRDDALDARSEARRQLMNEGNYYIFIICSSSSLPFYTLLITCDLPSNLIPVRYLSIYLSKISIFNELVTNIQWKEIDLNKFV